MNTSSHDFVTVDLRGLKAALVARAQAQRVSVSVVVRAAVARALEAEEPGRSLDAIGPTMAVTGSDTVKLSIRLSRTEAKQLTSGAKTAGLSRGAYLVGLLDGVGVLSVGASRPDHLAALIASSAELSTLSRNIHHLTSLLAKSAVRAAQEYREMLDTLAGDVHHHLSLASAVLADLRPRSVGAESSRRCRR